MLKRTLLALFVALAAANCAGNPQWERFQAAWDTLTGARLSPNAVYIAENSANAAIVVATNYLTVCHTHKEYAACSRPIELQVIKAARATRLARDQLHTFMVNHPDALGVSGVYNALVSATGTLTKIISDYKLETVK